MSPISPISKDDLILGLQDAATEALAAMQAVPPGKLESPGNENGWTAGQIMAHVASMEYAYRRLPDLARAPREARDADSGSPAMDRYNERQVAKRKDVPAAGLIDEFVSGRAGLLADLRRLPDSLLEVPVRSAGGADGTLAEVFLETAGSHVRQHVEDFARAAEARPSSAERAASALRLAAAEAGALLEGANPERWSARPTDDEWSPGNICGHMSELLPYWAVQIGESAANPAIVVGREIDAPERLDALARGAAATPAEAAAALSQAADEAGESLRRIPAAHWSVTIETRNFGALTVERCVQQLLVAHVRDHLRQLAGALRDGSMGA